MGCRTHRARGLPPRHVTEITEIIISVTHITRGLTVARLTIIFSPMRALCVGRHRFLSEHLCRFFENLGVAAFPCVGVSDPPSLIAKCDPDVVICDYDLLATMPLATWENDPAIGSIPVIAVSLTRHPGEAHLMDVNGIAGFLYLPTLVPEDAQRLLAAVRRPRDGVIASTMLTAPWTGSTSVTDLR